MVVASAATYANNQSALRKQNKITTNAILQRNQSRDQEAQAIKTAASQIQNNNAKTPIAQATQSYLSDLQNANPSSTQQAPTSGAMSQAYQQAAGAANSDVANKAKTAAGLMAITDAPGVQRQGEQSLIGQLGLQLGGIGSAANDATNLAGMKVKGVQPNPWVALAASALSSYAGSKGSFGSVNVTPRPGGTTFSGGDTLDGNNWNANANALTGGGSLYG